MKFKNCIFYLFCFFTLLGCGGNQVKKQEYVKRVKVEPVVEADSLLTRSFPGIIREAEEVTLSFRVAGPINRIYVKEGDYIRKGDPVAEIDLRDYELQLQTTRDQYDQVKAEVDRIIELYERKSIPVNDYEKAVSGLKLISSKLKYAEDQLNDTKLLSPLSGYVQKVNFRERELIDAGMPFTSVIDVNFFVIEVEIPASLYINRNDIVSFHGKFASSTDEAIPLQLMAMSRKANPNQLYKIKLRFPSGEQFNIASGMNIQVDVVLKSNLPQVVTVPLSALFHQDGNSFVWVYRGNGVIEKRKVVAGDLSADGKIEISEGLSAEELIVTAGVSRLHEDDQVVPIDTHSETNRGGLL